MAQAKRPAAKKEPAQKKPATAAKVDLRKQRKALYTARANKAVVVDAGSTLALAIDGKGHPMESVPSFSEAMVALYAIAYGIRFTRKKAGKGPDFAVSGPEALWWVKGNRPMSAATSFADWRWTVFLAVPDFVKQADVDAATVVQKKKATPLPLLGKVKLRRIEEGKSVQLLHVGPYDQEGPTVERIRTFAAAQGLKVTGRHHEIYLNDPSRVAPEKLKTILRFAVKGR